MLIIAFLEDMPRQIETLARDINTSHAEEAGKQAHKIRGAAANMSGDAMRETAGAMEKSGKAGDLESLNRLLPVLQENYEKLAEELAIF